jgi:hypothetical protein
MGDGYVHVMTEDGLRHTFRVLDTITDFTDYLSALEELPDKKLSLVVEGTDADLTAFYLSNERRFPTDLDVLIVPAGFYEHCSKLPEWGRKVKADKVSYSWDRLIEMLAKDLLDVQGLRGDALDEVEPIVRTMAQEHRFSRRVLGEAFTGFLVAADKKITRARHMQSPSGIAYAFIEAQHEGDRSKLIPELQGRAFLTRGMRQDCTRVVAIMIDHNVRERTKSFMLYQFDHPDWTDQDQRDFEELQAATGAWADPIAHEHDIDEYPQE